MLGATAERALGIIADRRNAAIHMHLADHRRALDLVDGCRSRGQAQSAESCEPVARRHELQKVLFPDTRRINMSFEPQLARIDSLPANLAGSNVATGLSTLLEPLLNHLAEIRRPIAINDVIGSRNDDNLPWRLISDSMDCGIIPRSERWYAQ